MLRPVCSFRKTGGKQYLRSYRPIARHTGQRWSSIACWSRESDHRHERQTNDDDYRTTRDSAAKYPNIPRGKSGNHIQCTTGNACTRCCNKCSDEAFKRLFPARRSGSTLQEPIFQRWRSKCKSQIFYSEVSY